MTIKLVEGNFVNKNAQALSQQLRDLADQADKGEITEMVASYVHNDRHVFLVSSSLLVGMSLAVLLKDEIVQQFKDAEYEE